MIKLYSFNTFYNCKIVLDYTSLTAHQALKKCTVLIVLYLSFVTIAPNLTILVRGDIVATSKMGKHFQASFSLITSFLLLDHP